MIALPVFWPVLKPALILRSVLKSFSVRIPSITRAVPVPLSMKPSEQRVNWYWPVPLFHWSVEIWPKSVRQVSNTAGVAAVVVAVPKTFVSNENANRNTTQPLTIRQVMDFIVDSPSEPVGGNQNRLGV